jgi:serine protease
MFGISHAQTGAIAASTTAAPAPTRLIVKLRSGATQDLAARHRLSVRSSRAILPRLQAIELQSQPGESMQALLARLRADPEVQYAEPDQRRYPLSGPLTPNDPLFAGTPGWTGQWYLDSNLGTTPSAIDAVDAWGITTGAEFPGDLAAGSRTGLVIADIDTGVRFDHPDLLRAGEGGRLLPGYTFISNLQVANDAATWNADASDPGDWVSAADVQSTQFSDCPISNSSWHGTRVAGVLGALTDNGVGVAGLTWNAWILPVRALGKCGGSDSDIETAMLWAAGAQVSDGSHSVPINPNPARIINLSLGAPGSCPASYADVVEQLNQMGVLVVAAAGNEGGPVDAPANCPGVLAVAGLREVGTKVGYSSLGPQVALSAPGGNCVNASGPCLYSIDTTTNLGVTTPLVDAYSDEINANLGTSFSTPLVSGIAGLMLSVNANLTPAQLTSRLQEGASAPFPLSADPQVPVCHVPASAADKQSSECSCTTRTCGAGMANALGAVNAALRPIAAIALPLPVSAGQPFVLDAAGSSAACGHTNTDFAWSVVNGTGTLRASGSSVIVQPPAAGSFTVQLVVTDDAGRTDTQQVQVTAAAATTSAPASAGSAASACIIGFKPRAPRYITVSPSSVNLQAGLGSQSMSAAVANIGSTDVTWEVDGVIGGNSTVGRISTTGLYTAPSNPPASPMVTVRAISTALPIISGFAGITITAPVAVSVAPSFAVVASPGGTQAFAATVSNSADSAVSWQVDGMVGGNASVGTISRGGLYTAPASVPAPALVTIAAVSAADATRSGSAQITVARVNIVVSPRSAAVAVGGSLSFVATVGNTPNKAVIWEVNRLAGGNSTFGMISATGMYVAPSVVPSPQTVTVTAVSAQDPTRLASAAVTVTAAASSSGAATSAGSSGSGGAGNSAGATGGGASGGVNGGGAMDPLLLLLLAATVTLTLRARCTGRAMLSALTDAVPAGPPGSRYQSPPPDAPASPRGRHTGGSARAHPHPPAVSPGR